MEGLVHVDEVGKYEKTQRNKNAHLRPENNVRERLGSREVPVVEGEHLNSGWSTNVGK